MDKGRAILRFKWHIVLTLILLVIVILLTIFTDIFEVSDTNKVPQTIWLLCALLILASVITLLSKVVKINDVLRENDAKLEQLTGSLEKVYDELKHVRHNTNLSESAKSIAFRDADRLALRDVVYDKLHQQEFDATYAIIKEISKMPAYEELADKLKDEADNYRGATDSERVTQVITHIEGLFNNFQWTKASVQIERLIKTEPNSESAKAMRQKLVDKKQEHKKDLLALWDDAINRQATDESLEILKELDLYLTPNEGLALQEAAKDVFRNKLHTLGVAFSFAVSEKNWLKAYDTGRQIMREFPNSRMAGEIRERMDILKQKIQG